jgi:hypothetical protein
MGMEITRDRLAILNNLYQKKSLVEVEDLTDEQGKPAGTKVTLKIPIEIESWEIQSM